MAYPAGSRSPKSSVSGSHRLLSVDLKTGKHLWEAAIAGDVISAPVIADDRVFITCFDGTSYAFNFSDGKEIWKKENAGTSAPVIANGQIVATQKQMVGAKSYEGLVRSDASAGKQKDKELLTKKDAGYLDQGQGGGVPLAPAKVAQLDSSVGFSSAPPSAQLKKAEQNVGVNSVVGGWAYQGSRAAVSNGKMLNSQGKYLNSVSAADGQIAWQAEFTGAGVNNNQQVFSPPALGREYMYLSGSLGHVVSVRQTDGAPGFIYSFKQPMVFQPALVNGNIYVGTAQGTVICLKTTNKDADGWYEWGGNAQHNKTF
jgi:outer membrane protein assembly factor BamB